MLKKEKIPDVDISLYRRFYSNEEAKKILKILKEEIVWKQIKVKLFGKEYLSPRLSAWYGIKPYKYSGYKW